MSMHPEIRLDIQGIRGLAICGVLAFHFFPGRSPQGYLGVDMFFVLSGFLMFRILLGKKINAQNILEFYKKRFKRIMPTYALMVFVVMLAVPLYLSRSDIRIFMSDALWSLGLTTNMKSAFGEKDGYWTQVNQFPLLLHTWSLSVEIQFYLIVPFLAHVLERALSTTRQLIFLCTITSISFLLHATASEDVAFGLMPHRMWQFGIGGIVALMERRREKLSDELLLESEERKEHLEKNHHPIAGMLLPIFLIILIFVPRATSFKTSSRFLTTLATALTIGLRSSCDSPLLTNRFILYLGDLSYVIYLIHWPIIILLKYNSPVTPSFEHLVGCLILVFIISIAVHDKVEIALLRSPASFSFVIVGLVYVFSAACIQFELVEKYSEQMMRGEDNENFIADAIEWNTEQYYKKLFDDPPGLESDAEARRWASHAVNNRTMGILHGNGTLKVLFLGNSYASRTFPTFVKLFNGRFAEFRSFTRLGCKFFTFDSRCVDYLTAAKKILEMSKPDVTFFSTRDIAIIEKKLTGPVENDEIFIRMRKFFELMSRNSRVVVYDYLYHQTPWVEDGVASILMRRLKSRNFNFLDLRTTWQAIHFNDCCYLKFQKVLDKNHAALVRQDALNFKNLIKNRIDKQLCPEGICHYYNCETLHAYFSDRGTHLTEDGMKLLEPGWSTIIEAVVNNSTRDLLD